MLFFDSKHKMKNTLVVLPATQVPAEEMMDLVVKHNIFNIVFYEHPHWFTNKYSLKLLVFFRASMQNSYDDYYDVFHDDKTEFHYIECDEKLQFLTGSKDPSGVTKLTGKVYVACYHQLVEGSQSLKLRPQKPDTGRRKIPFPAVLSPKSKVSWMMADTYIREKLKVDGSIPTIMPTWQPDIEKSIKKLKLGPNEYCPYLNLLRLAMIA